MSHPLLLACYCLLIVVASVGGGLIPLLVRVTHRRLQLGISFTAGFMLGVAALHMIPHAAADAPLEGVMIAMLIGLMTMFFIERFFSYHQHEVAELDAQGRVLAGPGQLPNHSHAQHAQHRGHAHAHAMADHTPGRPLSWSGAMVGMTLHSLIGGIALASAVAATAPPEVTPEVTPEAPPEVALQAGGAPETVPEAVPGTFPGAFPGGAVPLAGLSVFLVTIFHKPLDALTVITLTATAGFTNTTRHLINLLFALAVPLGVVLFLVGVHGLFDANPAMIGYALAFSAGTFLCISLSDLLPELHFHAHDRSALSGALILGLILAFVTAQAEHAMHDHSAHAPPSAAAHDHGHGHEPHDDHAH